MGMLKDPKFIFAVALIALGVDMFGQPIIAKIKSLAGVA
jgi:hypothetical protein